MKGEQDIKKMHDFVTVSNFKNFLQ